MTKVRKVASHAIGDLQGACLEVLRAEVGATAGLPGAADGPVLMLVGFDAPGGQGVALLADGEFSPEWAGKLDAVFHEFLRNLPQGDTEAAAGAVH